MLINSPEVLHSIDSLKEKHSFTSLPISYGFTGRENHDFKSNFQFVKQIHSSLVLEAHNDKGQREADGLFTAKKDLKIAVRTADCLPILLSEKEGNFVMALHAGWRGLAAGIILDGIKNLKKKFNVKHENLVILMGPCLSKEAFEVGPEVIAAFKRAKDEFMSESIFSTCYNPGEKDRSFFCLRTYAFYTLRSLDVPSSSISAYNKCTSFHNKNWYSYRKEAPLTAHNWSWISKQQ